MLDWEDAGGASGYELQIVESIDHFAEAEIIETTESEYEIPDELIICDTRYWRVRAVKDDEAGEWGETRSFKNHYIRYPCSAGGTRYRRESL